MTTISSTFPSLQSLACEAVNTNNKIRQFDDLINKILQFMENFQAKYINVADEDIPEQDASKYARAKQLLAEYSTERSSLAQKAKDLFEAIRDYNKPEISLPGEDQDEL